MKRRRAKQGRLWTSAASRRLRDLAGGEENVERSVVVVANRFLEGVVCPPTDLEAARAVAQCGPISG